MFQAVAEEPDAFDETDLELVELLAGHCATALERIEREATLRERTASLEAQNSGWTSSRASSVTTSGTH